VLYAAKCYWPGVTEDDVASASRRLPPDRQAAYVGSLVFPGDALVLCLFEASGERAVKAASEKAGFPCERVMSTWWITGERRPHCSEQPSR
jgi:hypothetical protein